MLYLLATQYHSSGNSSSLFSLLPEVGTQSDICDNWYGTEPDIDIGLTRTESHIMVDNKLNLLNDTWHPSLWMFQFPCPCWHPCPFLCPFMSILMSFNMKMNMSMAENATRTHEYEPDTGYLIVQILGWSNIEIDLNITVPDMASYIRG